MNTTVSSKYIKIRGKTIVDGCAADNAIEALKFLCPGPTELVYIRVSGQPDPVGYYSPCDPTCSVVEEPKPQQYYLRGTDEEGYVIYITRINIEFKDGSVFPNCFGTKNRLSATKWDFKAAQTIRNILASTNPNSVYEIIPVL
jgi:hypothetical protein